MLVHILRNWPLRVDMSGCPYLNLLHWRPLPRRIDPQVAAPPLDQYRLIHDFHISVTNHQRQVPSQLFWIGGKFVNRLMRVYGNVKFGVKFVWKSLRGPWEGLSSREKLRGSWDGLKGSWESLRGSLKSFRGSWEGRPQVLRKKSSWTPNPRFFRCSIHLFWP